MAGAQGVVITTDVPVEGRAAVPVYVDESLPMEGGPARAVQVVTSGPMAGGAPMAVRLAPAGTPTTGPALPIYIVSGSLSSVAPPSTLLNSLVSYWKLDEASGTRADSVVASGNDLTDNNTVTSGTGKIGNAGLFTSANTEWLDRADNASLSVGDIDFSLTAWVNATTFPSFAGIVSKGTGSPDNKNEYELLIDTGASNKPSFIVGNNTISATVVNGAGITTGTWNFIVGWHDATADTINIQVNNGTVVSTSYSGGAFDSTGTFRIGRLFGTNYWNGLIDEVGFWKRVLTAAERTALYNGGAGITYPFVGA